MTTQQQQAAQLYQDAQDAAAEAWQGAATNATAYMHPYSPQWDEDQAQAAYLTDWRRKHPQTRRRPGRWLVTLGALCVLGVGLAATLAGTYFGVAGQDGRWLGVALVGGLLLALLWRAARGGK